MHGSVFQGSCVLPLSRIIRKGIDLSPDRFGLYMEKIVVRGGNPLFGNVEVSGMKNAALPATATAHSTLITTTSLAFGFLDSKSIQKGIMVSRIMRRLVK